MDDLRTIGVRRDKNRARTAISNTGNAGSDGYTVVDSHKPGPFEEERRGLSQPLGYGGYIPEEGE